jgi:type VI secretion system protein ImpK
MILQEVLTATVRLRTNRQAVSDSESFRHHIREALRAAAQEARNIAAYSTDDIKMATFAVVGFLDESVLSAQNPMFSGWPRKTLQEELFGTHMAGEIFFQNLQSLLGRSDSPELADLLEVHYLCLLLGYRGRYGAGGAGELQAAMQAAAEKIRRIRGPLKGLSPSWRLRAETPRAAQDSWTRRFAIMAVACFLLALVMFIGYRLSLDSAANRIQASAAPLRK